MSCLPEVFTNFNQSLERLRSDFLLSAASTNISSTQAEAGLVPEVAVAFMFLH